MKALKIAFKTACAATVMGLMASTAVAQDMQFFRIGSGSAGGSYYPIAGLIAQSVSSPPGSRSCDDGGPCGVEGLVAIAQSSNGSVANVNGVRSGNMEAGLVQSDVAYWAHTGTGLFEDQEAFEGIRAIAALFPEHIHVVAAPSSEIATLADLKGKTVGIGQPASGALVGAEIILEAAGLDPETDMTAEMIHSARSAERIKDGQADAFITVTGYPQAAIAELASSNGIDLVPVDGEVRDKILADVPFYSAAVIPASVYSSVEGDTETISVSAVLVTSADQPEELIYGITKALFNETSQKLLGQGHSKGASITAETAATGVGAPLHPGAERFYREIGIIK